ncbi:hypothetical protein [Kitasatospora purpeofusca]|uniref:hypothetical protein n=1 Tax=Kitasatospora purpeofusca TaxID=67352 RepID=UPI003830849B
MRPRTPLWLTAGAVAALATLGASTLAMADNPAPDNSAAPPAVEDFNHPGVSPYGGIKLLRGDGHILATSCAGSYQIMVVSTAVPKEQGNEICFRVTSTSGFLTVEIPGTFFLQTEGHPVRATLDTEGTTRVVDLARNDMASVGSGSGTGSRTPTTLVELRVTG